MRLLVATGNEGKKAEFVALLGDLGYELVSLRDLGIPQLVEETGSTFEENALLKARHYATLTGLITLADDSGLEVDALGGEPGVRSARYAGDEATDQDRYRMLLDRLAGVPVSQRGARFRCAIAIAWPDGRWEIAKGACEGIIATEPRGCYGFGYDPVFHLPEYDATMAELAPEVKNRISHRARAAMAARQLLQARV
jgi:XTP/dITP diphosphohydrolase